MSTERSMLVYWIDCSSPQQRTAKKCREGTGFPKALCFFLPILLTVSTAVVAFVVIGNY